MSALAPVVPIYIEHWKLNLQIFLFSSLLSFGERGKSNEAASDFIIKIIFYYKQLCPEIGGKSPNI